MIVAVIRGFRQRRALKRELHVETLRVARQVGEVRRALGVAERRGRTDLEVLLATAPTCPTCGARLVVRAAKRTSYNGSHFWGCSRWPACSQPILGLDAYPAAALRSVTR